VSTQDSKIVNTYTDPRIHSLRNKNKGGNLLVNFVNQLALASTVRSPVGTIVK